MAGAIAEVEAFLTGGASALDRMQAPELPALPPGGPVRLEEPPLEYGAVGDALSSPSVHRPPLAMRVAKFPVAVMKMNAVQVQANENLLADSFQVRADGEVVVEGFITSSATASIISLSVDSGQNFGGLNANAALPVGAWFREVHQVHRQDAVNLQVGTATTITLRVTYREGE